MTFTTLQQKNQFSNIRKPSDFRKIKRFAVFNQTLSKQYIQPTKAVSCLFCRKISHRDLQCPMPPKDRVDVIIKEKRWTLWHWAREWQAKPCVNTGIKSFWPEKLIHPTRWEEAEWKWKGSLQAEVLEERQPLTGANSVDIKNKAQDAQIIEQTNSNVFALFIEIFM